MESFLKNLPKIELHAHLNGSLNIESIKELGFQLYGENSEQFLKLCDKFTDFKETDLDYCFQKFVFMHELTSTKKGLKLACEKVIRNFANDNVVYLELRTTPKLNKEMSRQEYINLIIETIGECSNKYNIIVKLLLSIDRSQTLQCAEEIMKLALEFNEKYPNIVKGIDMSGNPNKGQFKDFENILIKAKNNNLNLVLHCAEVSNPVEIQNMLDFGFNRCGHGTFLNHEQLQQCRQHRITIECCLTSNVKCGTVATYDSHHFKQIFENNIKVVLCTDDCGVFNTTLTEEFKLAYKHFQLKKADIYTLSINAIEASFANHHEKLMLKKCIENYFNYSEENVE